VDRAPRAWKSVAIRKRMAMRPPHLDSEDAALSGVYRRGYKGVGKHG
jgi:hypothetical protein